MRIIYGLFVAAAGSLLLPAGVVAQQPLHWQPTLESAKRLAAQTNRLVLIHFWADGCGACRQMEQEVFNQPGVVSALQPNYVPVKLNAYHFPITSKQYGIASTPTDVIITPQGQLVERLPGPITASQYVARLNQVAAVRTDPSRNIPGYQPRNPPGYSDDRYPEYYNRQRQLAAGPVLPPHNDLISAGRGVPNSAPAGPVLQSPPQGPLSAGPRSGNPPLGLDGYCPVQLCHDMNNNKRRWTLGNRLWGAIHRGRTYLFAGPEQQRRFFANPDRYAPVLSGNDVVTAVDQGQTAPGRREHGVFFANKIYLFANEANLEKFSKSPNQYANPVLQAMRAGPYQWQQLR